ncbi:MAG: CBS domain-containing protein [Thermoguttaceae bacterium]|jgi:CBS domain-containing protein
MQAAKDVITTAIVAIGPDRGVRRNVKGYYGHSTNGSVEYAVVLAMVCVSALASAAGPGRTICARIQNSNYALSSGARQPALTEDAARLDHTPASNLIFVTANPPGQYTTIAIRVLILGGLFGVACFLGWRWQQRRSRIAVIAPNRIADLRIVETEIKLFEKRQDLLRMLHSNVDLLAGNEIAVRHLLTPNPVMVSPETSVHDVALLMEGNRVHHILVCGMGRELLGVISDRDVRGRSGRTAQQIMTPKPNFVLPDTPLGIAITHLVAGQISCLPVVHAGHVCGILTSTDLMLVAQAFLQVWLGLRQKPGPTDDSAYSGLGNDDGVEDVGCPAVGH